MLVDTHCHLDFPDFAEDLDATVERARAAGVGCMVTICTHLAKFRQVAAVAERYPDILCTVGVHPHNAGDEIGFADEAALKEAARHPRVVGVGETGLDYFYDHSPRDAQHESFRRHIRVSMETGLPIIIHTRDADADVMKIVREETANGSAPLTGLLHCFSSSRQLAEQALEFGFYLSLSGIVTFKKAEDLRDTVRAAPIDRLLVETDAPYLAPIPHRGKRNEPSFVAQTAAVVASVKGVSPQELADATTANFFRLFPRAAELMGAVKRAAE